MCDTTIEQVVLSRADGTFYFLPCADGGYPLIYTDSTNSDLCAPCATTLYNQCIYGDNETSYTLLGWYIHYEGCSVFCAECNKEIESAYGDPDEDKV